MIQKWLLVILGLVAIIGQYYTKWLSLVAGILIILISLTLSKPKT